MKYKESKFLYDLIAPQEYKNINVEKIYKFSKDNDNNKCRKNYDYVYMNKKWEMYDTYDEDYGPY